MAIQWELILFTTFIAWAAGLFGAQSLAAAYGKAKTSQMTSWVCSVVLLAVGGIAVFFHLQHWERIFNGFGHLSSGITQELIAIVVLALVAIVFLVFMRRSEDGQSVPKWLAWTAVALSVVLVVVMAHSYMMEARPAWNSFIWVAYILGNALAIGPATLIVIMALKGDEDLKTVGMWVLAGSVANLLFALAYAIFIQNSPASFAEVGLYFDPVHPTKAMTDIVAIVGSQSLLLWLGAVAVGAVAPVIASIIAFKKEESGSWKIAGIAIIACVFVGAIIMRVVFYNLGLSIFMFY